MKRTTIKLSESLDALLRAEARQRGQTISQLTREAIEAHLRPPERRSFAATAAARSGRKDISERIEEILQAEAQSSR